MANASAALNIGSNNFDAIGISWTYGTGSLGAKQSYAAERTLAGTTADNLDMAGGLTNDLGEAITFTTLKFSLVVLDAPNGTLKLRLGPRGVTNAWIGPWESADAYRDTFFLDVWASPYATGVAITAGTADLFCIYNPTGTSTVYRVWLIGETA